MRRSASWFNPLAISGGALLALTAVHCASPAEQPPAETTSSSPSQSAGALPSNTGTLSSQASADRSTGSAGAGLSDGFDAGGETDAGAPAPFDTGRAAASDSTVETLEDGGTDSDADVVVPSPPSLGVSSNAAQGFSAPSSASTPSAALTAGGSSATTGNASASANSASSGSANPSASAVVIGSAPATAVSTLASVPLPSASVAVSASASASPMPSSSAVPPPLRVWQCPSGVSYSGSPIPTGATPVRVAGALPNDDAFIPNGWGNVEGPVWVGDSLYFTEMKDGNLPTARIVKLTPGTPNVISVWLANAGANGLALANDGALISANHKARGITRLAMPSGASTTLVSAYQSVSFNSPNDVTVRSDGNIYFSDPNWQNSAGQLSTRVYRLQPGATTAEQITDYSSQPNGVTLSLDEKTLFVSGQTGVKTYAVTDMGSVGQQGTAFGGSEGARSSDGMTLDCAGNLYVAVNGSVGINVFGADGNPVAGSPITLGGSNLPSAATNLAFGGADGKTLYITGQGNNGRRGLYEVKLKFPGSPY